MKINVEENLSLELLDDHLAIALFELIELNRDFLQPWMPSINNIKSLQLMRDFISGTKVRNAVSNEFAFAIIFENELIGRIGVYKIDLNNKVGELGYWLAKNNNGNGLLTKCCRKLTSYCFEELHLNRIEIKCATDNYKSQGIPLRLNYQLEGILRQAEYNGHGFNDLKLFTMLIKDWDF